jgi:hypothetical protein
MTSRTWRILKDTIIIAFFGAIFYGVTHNPVLQPSPHTKRGMWSIELRQRPLLFGVAGHNYLALRDDTGVIQKEFHGLATDLQTNTWKAVGYTGKDTLQVWEFQDDAIHLAPQGPFGITLLQGNKNDVIKKWEIGRMCASAINAQAITYPSFGVSITKETENSNSVAYTLIVCMTLQDKKHIGLLTPGWGKNLLENTPTNNYYSK